MSPIDLSSAANLWRLWLSREISAILYPAFAKRRLGVVLEGVDESMMEGGCTHAEAPPVPEELPTPATTKMGRMDMID